MTGSGQAPTPYEGMGTPTHWDARDPGRQRRGRAPRSRALGALRARDDAASRRGRRLRAAARSAATTSDRHPDGSTLGRRRCRSRRARPLDRARSPADRRADSARVAHPRGCRHHLRVPGRGQPLVVPLPARIPGAPSHPGPPRAGWRPRRGRLRPQQARLGRRRLRHQRSRGAQPRHRPGHRLHGLGPGGRHHRPGADVGDRNRQLPGVRRHRLHDVGRQALVPHHARRGHRPDDQGGVPRGAHRAARPRAHRLPQGPTGRGHRVQLPRRAGSPAFVPGTASARSGKAAAHRPSHRGCQAAGDPCGSGRAHRRRRARAARAVASCPHPGGLDAARHRGLSRDRPHGPADGRVHGRRLHQQGRVRRRRPDHGRDALRRSGDHPARTRSHHVSSTSCTSTSTLPRSGRTSCPT